MTLCFALFATPIGSCAILWGKRGITGLNLPQATEAATRTRVLYRHPDAVETKPPPGVDLAVRDIRRLLAGEAADLSRISLDMSGVLEFNRRVYEIARAIPAGSVSTYGEIATELGDPTAARAVGAALGANPFAIIVPCHRVLAAGGKAGGFSARGGITTKLHILSIERARTSETPSLFDAHGGLPLAVARRA